VIKEIVYGIIEFLIHVYTSDLRVVYMTTRQTPQRIIYICLKCCRRTFKSFQTPVKWHCMQLHSNR